MSGRLTSRMMMCGRTSRALATASPPFGNLVNRVAARPRIVRSKARSAALSSTINTAPISSHSAVQLQSHSRTSRQRRAPTPPHGFVLDGSHASGLVRDGRTLVSVRLHGIIRWRSSTGTDLVARSPRDVVTECARATLGRQSTRSSCPSDRSNDPDNACELNRSARRCHLTLTASCRTSSSSSESPRSKSRWATRS